MTKQELIEKHISKYLSSGVSVNKDSLEVFLYLFASDLALCDSGVESLQSKEDEFPPKLYNKEEKTGLLYEMECGCKNCGGTCDCWKKKVSEEPKKIEKMEDELLKLKSNKEND
jgi:hypothetical protein